MPKAALRNRHGRAGDAMTAINSANSLSVAGRELTSFVDVMKQTVLRQAKAKREFQLFGTGDR
jgi:hypothetical protein